MPHKSILLFQLHFQLCQKLKILKNQSLVLFFGVLKDKSHCPKLHANQFLKKSVMKEKNQLYFPCSQDEQQIFSPVTGNVTLLECSSLQTMRYNSLSDKWLLLPKSEAFRTESSDLFMEEKNTENIFIHLYVVKNLFCQYFKNVTDLDIEIDSSVPILWVNADLR